MENQNNYVMKVRDNYIAQEHTKLDELKELDKKVKSPALSVAYIFGSTAMIIFGTGMCLSMKVIGASIMSATALMTVGGIVGVAGIVLCIVNYFIYKAMLNSRKKKYCDQIVMLSNELLNKEN